MVLCNVMFLLRWENFTSTSFLGFNERCQYLTGGKKDRVMKWEDAVPPCSHVLHRVRFVRPACRHGFREHNSGCIHRLEYSLQVHPPCYLSDQHRSNTLRTQLLMNTKEVDFYHLLCPAPTRNNKGWITAWVAAEPIDLVSWAHVS